MDTPVDEQSFVVWHQQVKKHMAARGPNLPGGIITKEAPIHLSNVALIDPVQG